MGRHEPLTIFFVDHGEGLGGAEYSLLLLMRGLDRSRFKPVLICAEGSLAQAARAASIETCVMPIPQMRGRPTGLMKLWRSGLHLAALIRQRDARIIHSNTLRASFVAALGAKLSRRPFIWHARDFFGSENIGGQWYPWLMSRMASKVIANSRAVANTIPRHDVQVIYNGVEFDRFDPDRNSREARAALGLPECDLLIGTLGRMQPWKGHHLFLQAIDRIHQHLPQARFVIVGGQVFQADANYEDRLREQVAKSNWQDRIVFAGQQSNVPDWLAAMDIFVHCAQAEPFGRVVVEAMAATRPVIAFADGGVPEIVIDGETGRLVPPGDVDALADAILDLAHDRASIDRLGRSGRARAEAMFSAEAHIRQIEAIYEKYLPVL